MMPHQRQRYFDRRTGRELSRAEALENGSVLKDGVSLRVHMNARDSARAFWDANRDSLLVVDPRRVGGVEQGCRPGFRVFDNDLGRQAKLDAYQQYEAELTSAWGVGKHDMRTVDEHECPGDTGDESDALPQGKLERLTTATDDRRTVDQMARDHFVTMQRLYDAHARALSEEWRVGKGNK